MTYRFDHLLLSSASERLCHTSDDAAVWRIATLGVLRSVGRYSGSTNALARVVDEMTARTGDHRRRLHYLESRTIPVRSDADPDVLTELDGEIADLRRRVEQWSGTDNDPILDGLVSDLHRLRDQRRDAWQSVTSVAEKRNELAALELLSRFIDATPRIARLRSEIAALEAAKLDLAEELIDDLDSLRTIPGGFSSAIDLVRRRQETRLAALLEDLSLDQDAYQAAIVAMGDGRGPGEADLPRYLFPASYLASYEDKVAPLIEEVRRAEAEVDHQWAMYLGDIVVDDYDTYAIEVRLFEAIDRFEDLEAQLAQARSGLAWSGLAWLQSEPRVLLPPDERAMLVGSQLAAAFVSIEDLDSVGRVLVACDGRTAAAFFNDLDTDLVSAIPHFIDYRARVDGESPETARAVLRMYSVGLATAEGSGRLDFGGAELMDAYAGGIHPARLLTYGDFSDAFLLAATRATLVQGDDELWSLGINIPDRVFGDFGDPLYWDPREMLLARFAVEPALSGALVEDLAVRGQLDVLLAPEVAHRNDGGASAGMVLANLGVLVGSGGTAALFRPLLAEVVETAAATDRVLAEGIAEGIALMLLPSMEVFVPFHNSNGFYERDPLFDSEMVATLLARAGSSPAYDAQMADLLRALSRSGATAQLETQFSLFEADVIANAFDPRDLSLLHRLTDDLGLMKGVFFDTQFDLGLAEARRSDQWNRMLAGTIKGIAGATTVALTGGAGTVATLGLKRWATQVIARQSARLGAGQLAGTLLPTDQAEAVLAGEIDRDAEEEILYDLMAIGLLDRMDALDPPWPFVEAGVPYHPADVRAVQAWFTQVEVLGGELDIEEALNALRVIMVGEHVEIETGG